MNLTPAQKGPGSLPSPAWRALLALAALDSVVAGVWVLARPGDLLNLLQCPASGDRELLGRALGFLFLTHAPCLLLAAFRSRFAALTLLPLFGRLLSSGFWLWLLAAGAKTVGADPALHGGAAVWPWLTGADGAGVRVALLGLLAHDVIWPPLLAAFLWTRRANLTAIASPGSALLPSPPSPPA